VRRYREDEDWRTPWEREAAGAEVVAYEIAQVERSVANLRALGLL
jgi:hypothetical protein